MKLDVTFKDNTQRFDTSFGEVFNVSDGGYDRGYGAGYEKGKTDGEQAGYENGYDAGQKSVPNPLEYAKNLNYTYQNAVFEPDYELTLNLPNVVEFSSAFYNAKNLKKNNT